MFQPLKLFTLLLFLGVTSCSPAYAESIYATQLEQTVRIEVDDGLGTGVLIGKDTVLTAAHVVGDQDKVMVQFQDDIIGVQGLVIDTYPDLDLAVVHVKAPTNAIPTPVSCKHYDAGEPITIIGMPYGLYWVISNGMIATNKPIMGQLLVTNKTDHGNSGGPVFNAKKELIGILQTGIGGRTKDGDSNQGNSFGGYIPTELFCKELKLHEGVN